MILPGTVTLYVEMLKKLLLHWKKKTEFILWSNAEQGQGVYTEQYENGSFVICGQENILYIHRFSWIKK